MEIVKMQKYLAYVLDDESRERLLKRFPSKHEYTHAHHITINPAISDEEALMVSEESITANVMLYLHNEKISCVVVKIGGECKRPLGGYYHVTISAEKYVSGVVSNHLIAEHEDTLQTLASIDRSNALYGLELHGQAKVLERRIRPVDA